MAFKFNPFTGTLDIAGSGGGGDWGSITGTLSDQTDLQTALDGKVDENAPIVGATNTKITYDAKGLVTAGAAAITADINDSSNRRYVTDAQLTVIGNTSNTNTGDQTITLTGDVTGSGTGSFAASLDKSAITGRSAATPVGGDGLLITDASDTDNLKKITVTTLGGALVAGSTTQVQFNDVGAFGADAELTYNKTTNVLTSGSFQVGAAYPIRTLGANDEIVIGFDAGFGVAASAAGSVFIGDEAGYLATNAGGSMFLGLQSGYNATSASGSAFLGYAAGSEATNAYSSNFVGNSAGVAATNSNNANFFGTNAGGNASDAVNSNFFGQNAGNYASTAFQSNFFGFDAGAYASDANNSNFIGTAAGNFSSSASKSNFIGYRSGTSANDSNNSNFIGTSAGENALLGANSIFIGSFAGAFDLVDNTLVVGDWSIAIGPYSGTGGFSNAMAFGRGVINTATAQFNFGNVLYGTGIYNSDTQSGAPIAGAKVGIMTDAPTAVLDVEGDFKLGVGGSVLVKVLAASATLDFPSTSTYEDLTITVTGALAGDTVSVGVPDACMFSHTSYFAWVSAADTVTVRFLVTGSGPHNPPSATFKVVVTQF